MPIPNTDAPAAETLDSEISGVKPDGIKSMFDLFQDEPVQPKGGENKPIKNNPPPGEEDDNTHPPIENEPPEEGTPPKEEPKSKEERDLEELNALPKGEDKKQFNFRQLEQKKVEVENQLKEVRQSLTEKDKRIQELEQEIEKVAFERSPKFKSQFKSPRDKAYENIASFTEETLGDKSVIDKALNLKGKERAEFIDDKLGGGAAAAEFVHLLREYERKEVTYREALENNSKTKELLDQEDREHINDALRGFDSTQKVLSQRLTLFREIEGEEEHNKLVQDRITKARSIVTGEASDDDVLYAPFLAVVALEYISEVKNLRTELQKYKSRQKKLNETEPSISGAGGKSDKITKPKGMLSMLQEELK